MTSLIAFLALASTQGTNLISNGSFESGKDGWGGGGLKQVLSENGQNFMRMVIKKKPIQAYEVMITQVIDVDLPMDAPVSIQFEGRSPTGNKLSAMIEDAGQPYFKYVQSEISLTPSWMKYELKGKLSKMLPIGASALTFHFGLGEGTLDIRNIKLNCPSASVIKETFPKLLFEMLDPGLVHPNWTPEGKNIPQVSIVPSNSVKFDHATRVTVASEGANPWDCQVGSQIGPGARKKSIVTMSAWLRSKDKVLVSMVYEQNVAPNSKAIFEPLSPDNEWREYKIAVPSSFSFADNGSQVKFFFQGKGVVDIGPVSVKNFGPSADITKIPQFLGATPYVSSVAWRKQNDRDIAALRKGLMKVVVTDKAGKPVRNAAVKLRQDSHQFRFGTAIPVSLMMQDDSDGQKVRATIKRLFNTVTFGNDLKWNGGGPEIFADWIYPAQDWLKKNHIGLRGHNLVWGSYQYLPAIDKNWSKEKTWEVVEAHVRDYATRMKGKVYAWDVVNEAVTETELWEKIGWDKFVEVFRIVRQIDPTAKLAYNDYDLNGKGHRDAAIALVKMIQSGGAPIDIFGDQAHLSKPIVTPMELKSIWDEINAKTGLPIEVTEFDFSSFDDTLQADYVEDFYRAAFAHPKVESLIMWGFWEKDHWKAAQGGHMVRSDWTLRPAMTSIDRLINKDWKTNAELKTDAKGEVEIAAFYGDYSVTVGNHTVAVHHAKAGTVARIR